jgi:hypothetical protein
MATTHKPVLDRAVTAGVVAGELVMAALVFVPG